MTEPTRGIEEKRVPSILDKMTILPGDRVLWVIVALLFAISMVVVYSSVGQVAFHKNIPTGVFLRKHIITLASTAGVLLFAYIFSAKWVRILTIPAYVASLVATVAAYIFSGDGEAGARWLDLGVFSFQPSEFLKIATVMLLAIRLSSFHTNIGKIRLLPSTFDVRKWNTPRERSIILDEALPVVLPIALACAVILPAHTSSALHLFIISIAMILVAGVKFREVFKIMVIATVFGIAIMFLFGRGDTVLSRIKHHTATEEIDYSKKGIDKYKDPFRAKMAVHNGGVFGVGAGRSLMRARLVHPESDYLFSLVVEEFGMIVAFVIMLLYLWLFFRSMHIFKQCVWLYAGLLVVGLAMLIVSQAFLHISVNLGVIPETGQNLPFLTQGRSGMWSAGLALGLILGVSRQIERGKLVPPGTKNDSQEKL